MDVLTILFTLKQICKKIGDSFLFWVVLSFLKVLMADQDDLEKNNKNEEINQALKEFGVSEVPQKQEAISDPSDIAKKAQEAFREFELKKKEVKNLTQEETISNSSREINEALGDYNIKQEVLGKIQEKENPVPVPVEMNERERDIETINKTTDISQALGEFEVKQAQEELLHPKIQKEEVKGSKMIRFVIKYSGGLVKDERQASYVLLGVVVLFLVVSGGFFIKGTTNNRIIDPSVIPTKEMIDNQIKNSK